MEAIIVWNVLAVFWVISLWLSPSVKIEQGVSSLVAVAYLLYKVPWDIVVMYFVIIFGVMVLVVVGRKVFDNMG